MKTLLPTLIATMLTALAGFGAEPATRSLREAAGTLLLGVGISDRIPARPDDWP